MATTEEMNKGFNITSVSRQDLEMRGFDTTNITDEQMFWISLDIIAEDIMGFKKK